jgi:hypothetical protein
LSSTFLEILSLFDVSPHFNYTQIKLSTFFYTNAE